MSRNARLASLLRRGQWLLDEAAFKVGGERYNDEQKRELATALDELAAAVRESTSEVEQAPVVVEVEQ